jgi:DeoR/GlpR family transcriptional regulator of sugar metabolism
VVDHLFVGADGWLDGVGFTNSDQMRAEAVRLMAASAVRVVVLTESEKFGTHGSVPLGLGDKPMTVVTDGGVPDAARAGLERAGIEVVVAE